MTEQNERAPIGIQLFSLRGEVKNSLSGAIEGAAQIGYQAVEPWGFSGEESQWMGASAAQIRRLLDDNSLACCGFHIRTEALMGDNLARTIEFNQALGNRYLIIAADKNRMSSRPGIDELAGILDAASQQLEEIDMHAGYHAHGFDFAQIDGKTAWERLFGSTKPAVVMQIDIGNCAGGGGDPIAMLRQFPGRATSVHLKDFGGPEDAVIGEGDADWETVFELCDTLHKPEWYVVEEGGADGLGFDVSRRSLEALRQMGR
ncbi:MAG: TIM barrel protein [Candidatus Latescibacteria bacterium]|nr:TIM barrel protein [Candidatus Latescibacterota bacterium]